MAKKFRERFKTYGDVFDEFTVRNILKLASKGLFEESTLSPVSVGKEANVFSAKNAEGYVILKIYRINTCDFNGMWKYLRFDTRYVNVKRAKRAVIFNWCQREYKNLLIAKKAGLFCPSPLAYLNNVLVMDFIGGSSPAPKLKDVYPSTPRKFFNSVIKSMKDFYDFGFVHGDLSGFNILNFNNSPVFIDFSQALPSDSPNAAEILKRDIKNVCNVFIKFGLDVDVEKVEKKFSILKK